MGLRDVVKAAAVTAFNAIGDLKDEATYVFVVPGPYDPVTDTQVDVETTITIMGVLVRGKVRETDSNVEVMRTQFIVPTVNLGPNWPDVDDYLTINGTKYEVNDVKPVPGRAIYTFIMRAT